MALLELFRLFPCVLLNDRHISAIKTLWSYQIKNKMLQIIIKSNIIQFLYRKHIIAQIKTSSLACSFLWHNSSFCRHSKDPRSEENHAISPVLWYNRTYRFILGFGGLDIHSFIHPSRAPEVTPARVLVGSVVLIILVFFYVVLLCFFKFRVVVSATISA